MNKAFIIAGEVVKSAAEVSILRGLYLDQPHIVAQCDAVLAQMAKARA